MSTIMTDRASLTGSVKRYNRRGSAHSGYDRRSSGRLSVEEGGGSLMLRPSHRKRNSLTLMNEHAALIRQRRSSIESASTPANRKMTMQVVKELELKGLLQKAERERKEQAKMEELRHLRQSISVLRHYAFAIVGSPWFSNFIMLVIISNTVLITLQTVS